MFEYLKTLYNSMRLGAYYAERAKNMSESQLRDEMAALIALK